MSPLALKFGFISFLFCLIFHVLIWRTCRPKNDALMIFIIFFGGPFLLLTFYLFIGKPLFLPNISQFDIIFVFILHAALSSAYVQSYPSAEGVSPSMEIVIIASKHMPQGISYQELLKKLDCNKLVSYRLQNLLNSNLVSQQENIFILTPIGKRLIKFFISYRKLLGLAPFGRAKKKTL